MEIIEDPPSGLDILDTLLGINPQVKSSKKPMNEGSSQDVIVRLEYDDDIISAEAATAYLARFQHHLEYPN